MRKFLSPLDYSHWASHCLQQRPSYQWFWFNKADWAQESAFSRSNPVILIHFIRSARDLWASLTSFASWTKTWRWNSLQNSDPACTTNCWEWLLHLLDDLEVSMLSDPMAKPTVQNQSPPLWNAPTYTELWVFSAPDHPPPGYHTSFQIYLCKPAPLPFPPLVLTQFLAS